ncbi:hypothetical protein BOX15_Mlig034537g1, partial [Macrostomum lignano]
GVSSQDKDRAVKALESFVDVGSLISRAEPRTVVYLRWFHELRHKLLTSMETHQEIWGSFEQVMTPHVRRIVLSPAELITDHAEDPDWISSQDIKYYVDRLNNYPVTIREMDRLIVAMEIEINKIAECEARMRQLEAEAGPAGLQLDPTAAARLRDERVAMLLRAC